jgi:hypothetical protein
MGNLGMVQTNPEVTDRHGGAKATHAHRDHGRQNAPTVGGAGNRASPAGVSYRMVVRGGEGSGGPVWPTISLGGDTAISAAAKESSPPTATGSAAKGARQNWAHDSIPPSSTGGQPSQSPMSPPAIPAEDIASAMLVAFAACALTPAAKTTSSTTAKVRKSLSMADMLAAFRPMSSHTPSQAIQQKTRHEGGFLHSVGSLKLVFAA